MGKKEVGVLLIEDYLILSEKKKSGMNSRLAK